MTDPTRALRIVLADDALLLREALAAALDASGFAVVGQASDVPELLALVDLERPDVVVVDVRMPPTNTTEGLEAARRIRSTHPGTAVLVLSQYVETRYAVELIRDDPVGVGYLLKDRVARLSDLSDAVQRVAAGGSVIDPEVVARLLGRQRRHSPLDELTTRERQILGLMAEGRSNLAIAERLSLEVKTVEGHVGAIFSKLSLEPGSADHRRVLAVLAYLKDGPAGAPTAKPGPAAKPGMTAKPGTPARPSPATPAGPGRPVRRTFMFTDMVGSTSLIVAIGDRAWRDLRRWHDTTLRVLFKGHQGLEIDHAGDGFFVAFESAGSAVECAIEIQRTLAEHRRTTGFAPAIRIGLHTGDAEPDGPSLTGSAVHAAARVAATAEGSQILATSETVREARVAPVDRAREVRLKGLAEPVVVSIIAW